MNAMIPGHFAMPQRPAAALAVALCAAVLLHFSPMEAAAADDAFVIRQVDEHAWIARPEFPGLRFALLEGNPLEPGPYVILGRFAPGVMSP
ncbi:MAG: hypothetical protein D6773_02135, partial [Alphaproteobacteria bacterium]